MTINNTTGAAITLANNNNINLSNGSLTFTGANNLSFGTGVVTMSANNRTITTTSGTLLNNGLALSFAFLTTNPGSSVDIGTLGEVNLLVVPEPAVAMLLSMGCGVTMLMHRRRR